MIFIYTFTPKHWPNLMVRIICLFFVVSVFLSCNKIITEQSLVFDYHEISIGDSLEIRDISFPSNDVGYVVTNSGIYKTSNGGASWTETSSSNAQYIHFHSDDFGITNRGLYTTDGGNTWENIGLTCKGATISDKGEVIVLTKYSVNNAEVWKSEPNGVELEKIGILTGLYYDYVEFSQAVDGMVFFFSSNTYSDLIGMDMSTGERRVINQSEKTTGFCLMPGDLLLCGEVGSIGRGSFSKEFSDVDRLYFEHDYNYLNMDAKGDVFVAVGMNTIASNKKLAEDYDYDNINEVLDINETNFKETFKNVDIIDENNMVIVTSKNRIYKGTL